MLTGVLQPTPDRSSSTARTSPHRRCIAACGSGISRSFQILSVFRNLTVFENVRVAVQARGPNGTACGATPTASRRSTRAPGRCWPRSGWTDRAAEPCANLSHGEQRLLEIAITLATDAKLLLLDEPLAGLAEADREMVGALIRQLPRRHAVLLIEHDIDRVLAISDRITVLHQGRVIADGKPAEVAQQPGRDRGVHGVGRAADGPVPTVRPEIGAHRRQAVAAS